MILPPGPLKTFILYCHLLIALAQVSEDTLEDPLEEPKTPSIVLSEAERIESLQKTLWILEAMDTSKSVISGVRQALRELTTEDAMEAANCLSQCKITDILPL